MTKIWWIFRTEMRRLIRSRIGLSAVIVGTIIPLMYSSLYLYAFWDPYDNLNQFPIAIVNLDQGADKDGKHVSYGEELVAELAAGDSFKWEMVSEEAAKQGLVGDRYYLMMTIPATFSADVLSVEGDNPRKAELQFTENEGKNYIASTISKRLETTVREEVGDKFSEEYVKQVFSLIEKAGDGLQAAADGADKLADGAVKLQAGAAQLQDGTRRLQSGSGQLVDGARQVATGSEQLAQGAKQLSDGALSAQTGATDLQKGAGELATGSTEVATGLAQSTAGVKQVRDGLSASLVNTERLYAGLNLMQGNLGGLNADGHPQAPTTQDPQAMSALEMLGLIEQKYNLRQDPLFQGALQKVNGVSGALGSTAEDVQGSKNGLQQAAFALTTISNAQDQLVAGAEKVAAGNKQLADGAGRLQAGLSDLSAGTSTLAEKTAELASGSQKIADGTQQVAASSGLLVGGTGKLLSGSQEIADGNRKLADELESAARDGGVQNPEGTATVMASPIEVKSDSLYPVNTYGMGFAAYFIPLSLWVGALMLYFILSMREYRWFLTPVSTTSLVLGKFMTLAVIGVAQAVISSLVLTEVLGLRVTNLAEFYLFNILVSLTSIAIIGLLIARFGSGAGRFLAIVLLILQLTSSSGTFPIELVPDFFQAIHPFLPMTYGVDGLRALIAIGDQATVLQAVAVLGGLLIAVLVIHILTTRRTLRVSDLHAKDVLAG